MIVTLYRHAHAYSVRGELLIRVAAARQFESAWPVGQAQRSGAGPSGQLGFVEGQPVVALEPPDCLGRGRFFGDSLSTVAEVDRPPRHLVLLKSCNGDLRHAVWADGLDWQPDL